jgi:hypothetical protein
MKIEGSDVSHIQEGGKKPDLKDLEFAVHLHYLLDSLKSAQAAAKSAQKSALGSPKHGKGPASPLINDYQKYTEDLITFLTEPKPKGEGVPAATLQFIQKELGNIVPSAPNAGTQLAQILHQLFAIGSQVDPDFIKKVTTPGTTPGSDPGQAESDASGQVKTLQAELNNIIAGMGAEGKVFQDMINIQGFLVGYPNNIGNGTAFKSFGDSILDLAGHVGDPSPWGAAVSAILTQLSKIQNGAPLTDVIGTLYFLKLYGSYGNDKAFVTAAKDMETPLKNAIAQLQKTGIPFFQSVANKLGWCQHNFDAVVGPYDIGGWYPGGLTGGKLKSNWVAIASELCTFSTSSVSSALNNINSTINTLEGTQYQQLSLQLSIAEQAASSFQSLLAGNWEEGFPQGPYVPGPKAPESDFATLQTVLQMLSQLMLKNASDPQVQTLLNLLWQATSGPPYPQTIAITITECAETYSSLHPLTAPEKQMVNQAFTQVDALIKGMQDQENTYQQSYNTIQSMLKTLQGFPNCTIANFQKVALSLWNLLQTYEATQDPELKNQLKQLFALFSSAPSGMSTYFADFLFTALKGQGQSDEQIAATMSAFVKNHSDLQQNKFGNELVNFVLGFTKDKENPNLQNTQQLILEAYKGHEDEAKNLISTLGQMATLINTDITALTKAIQTQKLLEGQLRGGFPFEVMR